MAEAGPGGPIVYADFRSTAGIQLVGNAAAAEGVLRLTPAADDQKGAAWAAGEQRVQDGFTTTFQFRVSDLGRKPDAPSPNPGADGMAFVIQNGGPDVVGGLGVCMGYGGDGGRNGLANSLAVEFDMYPNCPPLEEASTGDPDGNHISIHSAGTDTNLAAHSAALGTSSAIPVMKDGKVHTCPSRKVCRA